MAVLRGERERAMPGFRVSGRKQFRCLGYAPQTGRRGKVIDSRAASDKRFSGAPVAECERRHQRRSPLVRATRFDGCAKIQQGLDERHLHSGLHRVTARYQHAHGCVLPAIHVGQRVNFGARREQGFCNFHGVRRSLLAVTFNAVGRDVMQKRGTMHRRVEIVDARRTRLNQFRIFAQQRFQRAQVAPITASTADSN